MSGWIFVRGAGDIATGVILRLARCGFAVAALETQRPTAIRRAVSLCEAVYDGAAEVEGLRAVRREALPPVYNGAVPILVDPEMDILNNITPAALVDATLAKRNLGLRRGLAPVTVALGPGFIAGADCDAVVETMRGHTLGAVLWQGSALPNTGVPGLVGGYGAERVIHAPAAGVLRVTRDIGSLVTAGEIVAYIGDTPVPAPISGRVRGMLRDGFDVPKGMKTADIDPRPDTDWRTVSDKARAVAGGVLEALMAKGVRP